MMPFADAVRPWHDFYALVGSASATLVGLLFVAASVGSSIYTEEKHFALRAFLSPSVVHFSSVLAACLITMIPTSSWRLTGLLIGADGLFGFVYASLVPRSMLRHGLMKSIDTEDRVWYAALPAVAQAVLLVAGVALLRGMDMGCGVLALAMGLLLVVAIRNSWDITVWAVMRSGS